MNVDIKKEIMAKIEEQVDVFKKVSDIQYRIRCPLCGDSQKNPRDSHMYIKASNDPTEPIVYNCFLCNSNGRMNERLLKLLNVDVGNLIEADSQIFNRISSPKHASVDILTGTPNMSSKQVEYIQGRLGDGLKYEDYDRFKIIWNIENIVPYVSSVRIKNILPNNDNSISFLSDNKSTIITRQFNDDRWNKTNLFKSDGPSLYTIKTTNLDLFTKDIIVVNVAEGIMDILSVYKNFNDGPNSVFIAVLGRDYESAISYAIRLGIVGYNVIIKIYLDSDIDEKFMKRKLKKYKWLFNNIIMYKNIRSKDVGVTIDNIELIEYNV